WRMSFPAPASAASSVTGSSLRRCSSIDVIAATARGSRAGRLRSMRWAGPGGIAGRYGARLHAHRQLASAASGCRHVGMGEVLAGEEQGDVLADRQRIGEAIAEIQSRLVAALAETQGRILRDPRLLFVEGARDDVVFVEQRFGLLPESLPLSRHHKLQFQQIAG